MSNVPSWLAWGKASIPLEISRLNKAAVDEYKKHPNLLAALDSWILIADKKLIPELKELGKLVYMIQKNSIPNVIYRGFDINSSFQEKLGLSINRIFFNKIIPFNVGDKKEFKTTDTAVSFTTDLNVAHAFGNTVVSVNMKENKLDSLLITDELSFVISERRNIKPETQKEIILLPPINLNFTIVSK